ncbi:Regulator of MON1-CCZ1 complex, C-terminal, partial [Dillenia turbinata]
PAGTCVGYFGDTGRENARGSLPIYSSKIALSVVDNVLLVHQVDAKVVILYDIFADSRAPISAPLPLLLRGLPRSNTLSRSNSQDTKTLEANNASDHEATIYGDGWTFLVPDLICDTAAGFAISASSSEVPLVLEFLQRRKLEAVKAKRLCLAICRALMLEHRPISMVARALDVLVQSYSYSIKTGSYFKGIKAGKHRHSDLPQESSPPAVAEESTRRVDAYGKSIKNESGTGVGSQFSTRPSDLSTSDSEGDNEFQPQKIKFMDLSEKGGKRVGELGPETSGFDAQPSPAKSEMVRPSNSPLDIHVSELLGLQATSAAISPAEMYSSVFSPVEEEMIGDPGYLVGIIVEFLRSANVEKIKVPPNLYVLIVQVLARSERYAELGLFVINKIIEPSKEVALQLLESGRKNLQTRKLGLDMLRRLSLDHDYVLLLVQDGYYLEALRFARKNKVNTIRPTLFLEAAVASGDLQHLAAVLRFFSDFIPGFRNTSDHSTYSRILNEMSSAIASLLGLCHGDIAFGFAAIG